MAILGNLQIEDAPVAEATTLEVGAAVIGEVTLVPTTKDPDNSYFIMVPLTYNISGNERVFPARLWARAEWFTSEYKQLVKSGNVADNQVKAYEIGMKKIRSLFVAAGLSSGNLDTDLLAGRTVGFRAVPDPQNPQYRVIQNFFTPRS